MTQAGFTRLDLARVLADLARRDINYRPDEVDAREWHFDRRRTALSAERPGPPEPAGVWETACHLVSQYEFSMPDMIRAAYDAREPLLGRNMLLEARFAALRLYLGVRITTVIDETRGQNERVWGWGYQTLQGHLERGRISYEVVKHQDSGEIEFVIDAHSQRDPTLGSVMRLGWDLFGRRSQLRFYGGCIERMHRFTQATRPPESTPGNGLVIAPSDARPHRLDDFALHNIEPGRRAT